MLNFLNVVKTPTFIYIFAPQIQFLALLYVFSFTLTFPLLLMLITMPASSATQQDIQRFRIRLSGRVQGVFFRASTKAQAEKLDLSGWVQNEPDGSVLVEAQGESEAVRSLIDWACGGGPPAAQVEDCQVEEVVPQQQANSFHIHR